jgi:hypothetical protein
MGVQSYAVSLTREGENPWRHASNAGNDYDKSFAVTMGGRTMIFDSFECAIQALAPTCPNCGNRIIGHGVEHNGSIFCCVHCAKQEGVTGLRDRD